MLQQTPVEYSTLSRQGIISVVIIVCSTGQALQKGSEASLQVNFALVVKQEMAAYLKV